MQETKLPTDCGSADKNNHDVRPPRAERHPSPSEAQNTTRTQGAVISQQPVKYSFAVPQAMQLQHPSAIPPSQILGNVGCPDVALFDSEIPADIGERPRINNALSSSSDADVQEYDKENHCVYRENIDDADNSANSSSGSDLFCIYPSPAFSEEDMVLGHTYSFGIESC